MYVYSKSFHYYAINLSTKDATNTSVLSICVRGSSSHACVTLEVCILDVMLAMRCALRVQR